MRLRGPCPPQRRAAPSETWSCQGSCASFLARSGARATLGGIQASSHARNIVCRAAAPDKPSRRIKCGCRQALDVSAAGAWPQSIVVGFADEILRVELDAEPVDEVDLRLQEVDVLFLRL